MKHTSSLLGVGESLSIELYDDDELLLAKSELIRRVVGGPRDVERSTDWNSSQSRLKRRDGPDFNQHLNIQRCIYYGGNNVAVCDSVSSSVLFIQ